MDKRCLLWLVTYITLCTSQTDFIQIVGYQKLPMAMKLYVDQYGHSSAPHAVYTPVGAVTGPLGAGRTLAGLQPMGLGAGEAFPAGLAGILRNMGGSGSPEREGYSTIGGNVEAEGPSGGPSSIMKSLQLSLGGSHGGAMNFDPSVLLRMSGGQQPTPETEASGTSSLLNKFSLSNMLNSGGSGNQEQMYNFPSDMGQFGQSGGQNAALAIKLRQLLAGGSARTKRQAMDGQQSGSNGSMNNILAKLKKQLKNALLQRISSKPHAGAPGTQERSGIAIFGAEQKARIATTATPPPDAKILPKSRGMPDPRRVQIRKALAKNSAHGKSVILRTSHPIPKSANTKPPILRPSINNPRPRFANSKVEVGGSHPFPGASQKMVSNLNPSQANANSLFSSMLNPARTNPVQTIREIRCLPGRTVPPEVVTIGPMSEIQRYECVIPLRNKHERLLGSFTVQQGESPVTCNVDHDRVQITGDTVQPICVHN